jgi:hypothetical protein
MERVARSGYGAIPAGLVFCASVWLPSLGCSGPPPEPPLREVKVKVLYQDAPAPFVIITFHPEDPKVKKPSPGGTEKDGTCTIKCPAGTYKVTMTKMPRQNDGPVGSGPAGDGAATTVPDHVFEQYRYQNRTPWTKTVSDSDPQDMKLVVQ